MGRKLTERQKVERAARKIERRRRDALGPLFAAQAEPVDRAALLIERSQGWACAVEHLAEITSDAVQALDLLAERALEALARRHMPAEWVEAIAAYRRRTFPPHCYGVSFWLDILAGRAAAPVRLAWVDAPEIKAGRRLVVAETLPPAGWAAPFAGDEAFRRTWFWRRCPACRMWHGPGQIRCAPDPEGLP